MRVRPDAQIAYLAHLAIFFLVLCNLVITVSGPVSFPFVRFSSKLILTVYFCFGWGWRKSILNR